MKITKKQAIDYILTYQHLNQPRSLVGKNSIMEYIAKVGCIQFDPLNRVGTNPNLVLQSRIKDYKEEMLYKLMYKDRRLIDDWDKNMSIYKIEDWPYFKRYRESSYKRLIEKTNSIEKIVPQVRDIIEKQGPLSSKDLDFNEQVSWYWAPTRVSRAVLESMYYWGDLIIHHKDGTRKYYDLSYKHIPTDIYEMEDPNKTIEDYFKWHVQRRIGAIGLLWRRASDVYLGMNWIKSKDRKKAIDRLIDEGKLIEFEVEDINYPFVIRKEDYALLKSVENGISYSNQVSFIAPLDNMMWDRKLIKELFNFEYTWEVYKPQKLREYGYYVLPVLYKDQFIARVEPKFDKKSKTLHILNWWWEEGIIETKEIKKAIKQAIADFSEYLNAKEIKNHCKSVNI